MPKLWKETSLLFFCDILRVIEKIDFFHADKHESLLQIDTVNLNGIVKHCQSFQNSKFAISLQYVKKILEIK